MLVSEQARVFQVRGLRCSKEPTVLGLSPVRLGNRTYRAWMIAKLTPMVPINAAPAGRHVLYQLNLLRSLLFKSALPSGTSRYKRGDMYKIFLLNPTYHTRIRKHCPKFSMVTSEKQNRIFRTEENPVESLLR